MSKYIIVAVSPNYSGFGWRDKGTEINFEPTDRIKHIRISSDRDLSGIKNALRLNHLLLIDGELDSAGEVDNEALDPGMMTKQQLDVMIERLKSSGTDDGALKIAQDKVLALEKEKTTLQGKVTTADKAKKALDAEIVTLKARVLELEEATAPGVLSEGNTYTEVELNKKTNVDLKVILDDKQIAYTESDKKADLVSKLVGIEK